MRGHDVAGARVDPRGGDGRHPRRPRGLKVLRLRPLRAVTHELVTSVTRVKLDFIPCSRSRPTVPLHANALHSRARVHKKTDDVHRA